MKLFFGFLVRAFHIDPPHEKPGKKKFGESKSKPTWIPKIRFPGTWDFSISYKNQYFKLDYIRYTQ